MTSVAILVLLAGIGVAVYLGGQRFDPNRFSLRPGALSSTSGDVEGKPATLRETAPVASTEGAPEIVETGEGYAESGDAPAAANGEPLNVAVEGVEPMGDTEFYVEETLYEKIDGRAPAYSEFEFRNLRARSFSVEGSKESYIDVLEFEMSSPVTAFGIFSAERDADGKALDFGDDGYASEMGYFLRQGPRYVQIIASDRNPETLRLAEAIARDRAARLPSGNEGLGGMALLPKEGMRPGSIEFVQSNAFGQAALHDVYQARYDFEGAEVAFFAMKTDPAEARKAWNDYKGFAGKYGTVAETFEAGGAHVFVAESFGNWIAIFVRADDLGGVAEAPSQEAARGFVAAFLGTE